MFTTHQHRCPSGDDSIVKDIDGVRNGLFLNGALHLAFLKVHLFDLMLHMVRLTLQLYSQHPELLPLLQHLLSLLLLKTLSEPPAFPLTLNRDSRRLSLNSPLTSRQRLKCFLLC